MGSDTLHLVLLFVRAWFRGRERGGTGLGGGVGFLGRFWFWLELILLQTLRKVDLGVERAEWGFCRFSNFLFFLQSFSGDGRQNMFYLAFY